MSNSYISSSIDTTVDITADSDFYIINALTSTSYTYNLPDITCDGINFTMSRVDGTSGVVTLVGPITFGQNSYSTYIISGYSSLSIISLEDEWHIYSDTSNSSYGSSNIFSTTFIHNNGNTSITIKKGRTFVCFPFIGTSNGGDINSILFSSDKDITSARVCLYRSDGTYITTVSGDTVNILTSSEKALLPENTDFISVVSDSTFKIGFFAVY